MDINKVSYATLIQYGNGAQLTEATSNQPLQRARRDAQSLRRKGKTDNS